MSTHVNKRVFYAVESAGIAPMGSNTFTAIHGLQSLGVNTKFNLEQVFEMGQINIYDNVENIPDIEVTAEKVLDGYPLIYHLATYPSPTATLSGRSNTQCILGMSIFSDVQDSASGTPLAQCTMSGLYVSGLNYNFDTNGSFTEQVTLVGNNKVWTNSFTATSFNNNDAPLAGEVQRRQMFLFGESSATGVSLLPQEIPGITSSGTNPYSAVADTFGAHIQSIKVSTNLGRQELFELGRKGLYYRYAAFPVEVRTDIDCISITGDTVQALQDVNNLTPRQILIMIADSTKLDLGSQNMLTSVSMNGGNAGQNGGNQTLTFSYSNFNNMAVTQNMDPSGL